MLNLDKIKNYDELYENCEKVCASCPFKNKLDNCETCPVFLMMDEITTKAGLSVPF